jgi:hypothetical protein
MFMNRPNDAVGLLRPFFLGIPNIDTRHVLSFFFHLDLVRYLGYPNLLGSWVLGLNTYCCIFRVRLAEEVEVTTC